MDIKKLILAGSCVASMGMFGACSDDSGSGAGPEENSSSSVEMITSVDANGNEVQVPASSASATPGATSSAIADDAEPQMACSEIMYNAPEGSSLEWVEVYIAGGMDMDNMQAFELHLSGAVDYSFPAEALKKGEYVVVTNDTVLFRSEYPDFAGRLFGNFTGKMTNEGDVVNVKVRGEGDVTCAFSNEPPWPSLADGKGRSLVYKGGNASQPNSWGASSILKGNPGVGNDEVVKAAKVRINEVKPFALGEGGESWMELYNAGNEAVDVSGWTVEIKRRKQTITIKAGSVPANGYLVLNGASDFDQELVISDQGGEIYLYGAVEGDESSIWVPASKGTSGVVDLADGSTAQGPLAEPTKGTANAPLQLGSVLINEIHYHPAETGVVFEFLELVNRTSAPITLYNGTITKGWKVEGIGLEFLSTDVIPANGMMLLISDTLAAEVATLRSMFNVAEDVPIKLYPGKLSNRGETIAVKEPFAKEVDGDDPTNVKYFFVWHDATLYSDTWPGLGEADGAGFSLQRKADAATMGYEASAWKAAEPTPGK